MILTKILALLFFVWLAAAFGMLSYTIKGERTRDIFDALSFGCVFLSIITFTSLIGSLIVR